MKHILITTIAAVVLVVTGLAGPIHDAIMNENIDEVQLQLAAGADVNAMNLSPPGREIGGMTPLDMAILGNRNELAALIRKHGGKTGEELKAEGN